MFEFRAKGKEGIARSIFCTVIDNEVVILHTVIKKSNAIPKKDLDLAKKKGIMMSRPTFEDFKKEALLKPSLKEEYENLAPEYELKMKLIEMRKEANLTQEEIAKKMNTKRSNISRLESFTYNSSPNISTLMAYAQATGHQLKVEFV